MRTSYWIYKNNNEFICANCNVTVKSTTPYCAFCGSHMANWLACGQSCSCYHIESDRPCCWGTKEVETCSCGGDERKCDFYEYIRDRANKCLTKK